MLKYNWTIDDLKNRYYKLLQLQRKEKNPDILLQINTDIYYLKKEIDDMESKSQDSMPNLLTKYGTIKASINDSRFLYTDIKDFYELIATSVGHTPDLKQMSLSKDDILDLTHDFYKHCLDKFFFHNFLKYCRKRYNHVTFIPKFDNSKLLGKSIGISALEEIFISLRRNDTIDDILTVIHEFEHGVSMSINYAHLCDANLTFCEIDTIFMEMIGADYLENIFQNNQAFLAKAARHEGYYCMANTLVSALDLVKAEEDYYKDGYTCNKHLKESAKKHCRLISEEVDSIIQHEELQYDYVISYIFAVELYKMYQEDRDKALYYLRKLILLDCKNELEYYNSIKRMGLIPNQHMREYHNEINESIRKLEKKN